MVEEISTIRKWILFPESLFSLFIAFLFIFGWYFFPQYSLYLVYFSLALIALLVFFGKNIGEKKRKLYLYKIILILFIFLSVYFVFSEKPGYAALLFLIGCFFGVKSFKYEDEKVNKSRIYATYNHAPFGMGLLAVVFILGLIIGFQEKSLEAPIMFSIFSLVGMFVLIWSRKKTKKAISEFNENLVQ